VRPPPVVALLTDFGLSDHYVGTLKGVILGICPNAALVDITHDVPPQDTLTGALAVAAAAPFFPAGTIFLAVVDPGVGSSRRGVAAQANERLYVGPDNGLFSIVFDEHPPERVVELSDQRFALREVCATFEGRDRFAPAAAWLAAGTPLIELGRPLDTWTRLQVPAPRVSPEGLDGEVLHADHFGNLITNIPASKIRKPAGSSIEVAGRTIRGVVRTYADAAEGGLCALVGSTRLLEVAVRGGSAARLLGAGRGTPVRLLEDA
jgi:S-adenosylmethionine hydrolase